MADFFSNLLDRAFDRAPVIQPQRAPLFAPEQRPDTPPPAWDNGDLAPPPLGKADEVAVDNEPRSRVPRPAVQPAPFHLPADDLSTFANDNERVNQPQPTPTFSTVQTDGLSAEIGARPTAPQIITRDFTAPLDTIRVVERQTLPNSALDEDALFSRLLASLPKATDDKPAARGHTHTADEQNSLTTRAWANNAATTSASQPAPDANTARRKPPVDGEQVVQRLTHQPQPAPATTPVAHVPTIRRAERDERAHAPAEAAPSVNISIGRVEVRATQPPAPHPQTASRARQPRLTLDAYLEQRRSAGGAR